VSFSLRMRWLLAGMAVGAAFLWLALRLGDARQAWHAVWAGDWRWALAAWLAAVAFMALKAWRWQWLLRPLHRFDFSAVHAAVYAGTAANLVVPHSGEFLRASLMGHKAHRPASPFLPTVGVERVLDFLALAFLCLLGVLWAPQRPAWLLWAAGFSVALAAFGACIMAIWMRPTPRLRGAVRALLARLPGRAGDWLTRQLGRGAQGLAVAGTARAWLGLLALSLLQWACVVLTIAACAGAVGAYPGGAASVLVFALMVLGLTLPSPPIQLGATQLAFVFGFEWAGLPAAQGLAASLVYTGVVLAWMLAAGAAAGLGTRWSRAAAAQQLAP
jgi:glycosyltransferase 2 family protein